MCTDISAISSAASRSISSVIPLKLFRIHRHRRLSDAGGRRSTRRSSARWRAEPRVRRRGDDRLVPRASSEIRNDLPDDQPGGDPRLVAIVGSGNTYRSARRAFGVIWSFVQGPGVLVLRFKDQSHRSGRCPSTFAGGGDSGGARRHRGHPVLDRRHQSITKQVATVSGVAFTSSSSSSSSSPSASTSANGRRGARGMDQFRLQPQGSFRRETVECVRQFALCRARLQHAGPSRGAGDDAHGQARSVVMTARDKARTRIRRHQPTSCSHAMNSSSSTG